VQDLRPISNLLKLRFLGISRTQVSDLSPIVNLVNLAHRQEPVRLASGALQVRTGGVQFQGCPVADKTAALYARLSGPDRTRELLDYLREKEGLPPITQADLEGSADKVPPRLPTQGIGPHFSLQERGLIGFAPPPQLDQHGNEIERLEALHAPLREVAQDLSDGLSRRRNQYPELAIAAQRYFEQVTRDLTAIDFAQLYGSALRLEVAEAVARREIDNGTAPGFDPAEEHALRNVLLLHGPFILASSQGRALLTDAERYPGAQ